MPGVIANIGLRAGFVYFASYTYFTSTYFPWMPNHGRCAGEEFAAFAGMGIISSYLVLFISFYFATYRKEGKAPSGRKAVRRMSQAPLPDPHDIIVEAAHGSHHHSNGKATTTGAKATGPVTRSRKAL
jgi:fatty acid elongase 3